MLTDQYNRNHTYLRISLTDKCNLRCTYCNPVDLPKGYFAHFNKMSPEEIDYIAGIFVSLGITKIRLTGGEPLVRKDAGEIIRRLSGHQVELTITTNGVFVHEYLDIFKAAGIRSVNVSLDSLDRNKNQIISGRDEYDRIRENIDLLQRNDFHVKVNTVIMKGVNDNEIPDFIAWTARQPVHVRFIEFMPFTGNHWSQDSVFSHQEILDRIGAIYEFDQLKRSKNDTAMKYAIPGHPGTFGVISTMSQPFCGDCNRLRLTTDGKMKNCLFSRTEVDLLSAMRKGEDIVPLIQQCGWDKKEALGGQFTAGVQEVDAAAIQNRSMIQIGG